MTCVSWIYKITLRPCLSRGSPERPDRGGELREDLRGERPGGRRETAVGEVLGQRDRAERSPLTDVDVTGGQTTLEQDGHPLAHQRVERMHHDQRV